MHDLAFEIYFLGGHQLYEFLRLTLFLGVLPSLDTVTRRCKAGRTVITHVGFVRERFLDLPAIFVCTHTTRRTVLSLRYGCNGRNWCHPAHHVVGRHD